MSHKATTAQIAAHKEKLVQVLAARLMVTEEIVWNVMRTNPDIIKSLIRKVLRPQDLPRTGPR